MSISFVKVAITAILAASCALAGGLTQASPAQAERSEFCKHVPSNVQAGADAKRLGMTEDDLNDKLFQYVMGVLQSGVSRQDAKRLVEAVIGGYATFPEPIEALQAKLFKACMEQVEI